MNENQYYNGTSEVYIPVAHDAIEARVMRFTNTLFPQNGRHVDAVVNGTEIPHGTISLLENYVRTAHLREITPALLRNGDVEGHYSVMLEWEETKRVITKRVKKNVEMMPGVELDDEYETVEDEVVYDRRPVVTVLSDSDIAVAPATASSPEDAEIVAIAVRLSKAAIKKKIKDGDFDKKIGEALIENFTMSANTQQPDPAKEKADAAGVKLDGASKTALLYMVWT